MSATMKKTLLQLGGAILLLTLSGHAFAAVQRAFSTIDFFWAFLLVCWVGMPALLVCALVWSLIGRFITSLRPTSPFIRPPDTDLMA